MKKSLFSIFLPTLCYALLSTFSKSFAVSAALFLALGAYKKLRRGFLIEWCNLSVFTLSFFLIVLLKNSWYEEHESVFTTAIFAIISWVSLLLKKPFTLQYARQEVEEEKWHSFLFIRINTIMTLLFSFLFSVMTALNLIHFYHPTLFRTPFMWIPFIVLQIILIRRFPRWYIKRYGRLNRGEKNENYSH